MSHIPTARACLLLFGGLAAAWAGEALWRNGEWQFAPGGSRTIHHRKGGVFQTTGDRLATASRAR